MKTFLASAVAVAALAGVAAPAAAQSWMSINQRQAELDRRIDAGVRTGDLTRREAVQLRSEFTALARLETDYRRSGRGLDVRERADLDRRFDALSARIRFERNDRQDRGDRNWQSINQRQANLDRRIDNAIRNRQLTLPEAVRLRAEFAVLNRLETTYRNSGGGLSASERADLDRRFDALSGRIRDYRRN